MASINEIILNKERGHMQDINININFRKAKEDIGFTFNSDNRVYFKNLKDRDNWEERKFEPAEKGTFTELSTFTASVNYPIKGKIEAAKTCQYISVEVEDFKRFYFVVRATVKNNKVITYTLRLDTFTTYQLIMEMKGHTILERGHGTRFKQNPETKLLTWNKGPESDIMVNEENPIKEYPIMSRDEFHPRSESRKYEGLAYKYNEEFYLYAVVNFSDSDKRPPKTTKGLPQAYFIAPLTFLRENYTNVNGTFYDGSKNCVDEALSNPQIESIFLSTSPLFVDETYLDVKQTSSGLCVFENSPTFEYPQEYELVTPSYEKTHIYELNLIPTKEMKEWELKSLEIKLITEFSKVELLDCKGIPIAIDPRILHLNLKWPSMVKRVKAIDSVGTLDITIFAPVSHFEETGYLASEAVVKQEGVAQVPSISDPYKEYMKRHGSSYHQEKIAAIAGLGSGLIGGATSVGIGMLNPAKGVGAIAKGASSIIGAPIQFGLKLMGMHARINDLKRTPEIIKGDNLKIQAHAFNATFNYTNTGHFALTRKRPAVEKENEVFLFLKKYGYQLDKTLIINNISELMTRTTYNYILLKNPQEVINRTNLPTEVFVELVNLFNHGFRLWASNSIIGKYDQNNWEKIVVFDE